MLSYGHCWACLVVEMEEKDRARNCAPAVPVEIAQSFLKKTSKRSIPVAAAMAIILMERLV
jgi:hypothetical protein